METKDYLYLGLIALTATVFYWHGYLAARSRARKAFAAVFNERRTLVEMPEAEESPAPRYHRAVRPSRGPRRGARIRAVFGIN